MNGLWTMVAATVSFAITAGLGKVMVPLLQKIKYGQTILEIGPSWHKKKQGTPTMGGIMFIIGITLSAVLCIPGYYIISDMMGIRAAETPFMISKIFLGLTMALFYGAIGFFDDYIKVVKKRNKGLSAKQKLIMQFLAAGIYLAALYASSRYFKAGYLTSVRMPFLGSFDFGLFYWPLAAIIIVGIVNAVNLTDGIDGLNSSVTFFAAIFYMVITGFMSMFGLSMESAALAGGCLGFLVWNFSPARIFMGDTGSLFLGGMVCAIGIGAGLGFILVLISMVYIIEMFSVILQVIYFRVTGGKRLFKMSPLHHHFEMIGWSEVKICIVFSIFEIILGVMCLGIIISGL